MPGDPLHRGGSGGAQRRSGCWRWGAQAAGWQGSPRCRDPWPGKSRAWRGGLLTSQPRCLPAAGPRERAPAPARAPPPGSLRVSNPQHPGPRPTTHRSPPATARAALGTRSTPPPPPPEALLPPRRPCAPPPSGARPQSASPRGAQRPGWAGLGWAAAARGRPRTRPRSRCALEAASAWSRRDPLCPRFCFWLHHELPSSPSPWCGAPCHGSHFGFPETDPLLDHFSVPRVLRTVSILSFIHSNHCFPKRGIWHHWGYKAILGGTGATT